jgi:hypothetical protein
MKNSQFKTMSIHKEFTFHYPLKHKVVRDLRIVTEHVGDLEIEGTGYFDPTASVLDIFDRYSVDIDFVKWNGTDIRPVLEVTGAMDDIIEAAIRYFAGAFENGINKAA